MSVNFVSDGHNVPFFEVPPGLVVLSKMSGRKRSTDAASRWRPDPSAAPAEPAAVGLGRTCQSPTRSDASNVRRGVTCDRQAMGPARMRTYELYLCWTRSNNHL